MRKKGRAVPEWLNSPIWSATPPAPAQPDPYGADLAPPPPPKPPPPPATASPVPPPPSYEQAVGVGGGRREEEDDEGAGAVIRAHLLSDFKAAVRAGKVRCWLSLGFSLAFFPV
jgi:TBC1 domain family member 13